jgi:arsenate reductase-like glutaredoxin family protein
MNRSYSKIRHIQEANKLLERKLIIEGESDTDTSSLEPTQQELSTISDDPNKNEKYKLGKKLTDLFLADQPPSTLKTWLEQNQYKKLLRRLDNIYKKYNKNKEYALTEELLTWLGDKYINDTTLKSNVDRINKEHIEKYNELQQALEAYKKQNPRHH